MDVIPQRIPPARSEQHQQEFNTAIFGASNFFFILFIFLFQTWIHLAFRETDGSVTHHYFFLLMSDVFGCCSFDGLRHDFDFESNTVENFRSRDVR